MGAKTGSRQADEDGWVGETCLAIGLAVGDVRLEAQREQDRITPARREPLSGPFRDEYAKMLRRRALIIMPPAFGIVVALLVVYFFAII